MMSAAYKRAKELEEDEEWRGVAKLAKSLSDIATKRTIDDFAPNKVHACTRLAIERLARAGKSLRSIARELRISTNTVDRYFPRDAACACGKLLIDHRGWCSARYAESQKRQEAMSLLQERRKNKKATE